MKSLQASAGRVGMKRNELMNQVLFDLLITYQNKDKTLLLCYYKHKKSSTIMTNQ